MKKYKHVTQEQRHQIEALLEINISKTKDIAQRLEISAKTVDTHKQSIQRKYGFKVVIFAVLYGVKIKIIEINTINHQN